MNKRGRYYLGRVIKLGQLDQTRLMNAVRRASILTIGKFTWTITDVAEGDTEGSPFIFGQLAKYSREGHVTVVDSDRKSQVDAIAPNLLVASSPFLYMPEFSGIAYLHVWNGIQQDLFTKRFKTIIEATHGDFFVECSIEPIADYQSFAAKLSGIHRFTELSAKVHPPNPLFGRCWKRLNEYVKRRNADEVSVSESKEDGTGLVTSLVQMIEGILSRPEVEPESIPDITDAAILMAADGYGHGKVVGYEGDSVVTVRTSDTQKSFLFPRAPEPVALAQETKRHLAKVSHERTMKHDG